MKNACTQMNAMLIVRTQQHWNVRSSNRSMRESL